MTLFDSLRTKDSTTLNGAITHSTSLNAVLDMFFIAGASRKMSEQDIINMFVKAREENESLAMKCLFWARDIRGGAGERRFFKIIWDYLPQEKKDRYRQLVVECGRYKDLFECTSDKNLVTWISETMKELRNDSSLLCKWFPRKGKLFNDLCKYNHWTPKMLRRFIVDRSKTVEQDMSAREWGSIEYNKIPSQAFQKYKKAFERNDQDRFKKFIEDKPEQIKSGTLFPYQLYQSHNRGENPEVINAQWNNLPNYLENSEETFLPVCDVSGSMGGLPMDISVSLGVYLSERNKGAFKDGFITFSIEPRLQYLKGSVTERFFQLEHASWDMSTNFIAVFDLILNKAIESRLSQSDMPSTVICISDMEFDQADREKTNFEAISDKYEESGYRMPKLVFWNVQGRVGNVPVQSNQTNVALVSGASPEIIKNVLSGLDMTPISIMMKTLQSERYKYID